MNDEKIFLPINLKNLFSRPEGFTQGELLKLYETDGETQALVKKLLPAAKEFLFKEFPILKMILPEF